MVEMIAVHHDMPSPEDAGCSTVPCLRAFARAASSAQNAPALVIVIVLQRLYIYFENKLE